MFWECAQSIYSVCAIYYIKDKKLKTSITQYTWYREIVNHALCCNMYCLFNDAHDVKWNGKYEAWTKYLKIDQVNIENEDHDTFIKMSGFGSALQPNNVRNSINLQIEAMVWCRL